MARLSLWARESSDATLEPGNPSLSLPVRIRTHSGGGWHIIPRSSLGEGDAIAKWVSESALGLLDLYKLRSGTWDGVGCVAKPPEGAVGDPIRIDSIRTLHRAVVAALLDPNPSLDDADAGHQVATSDNAIVFGHRVDGSGSVFVNYGVMVRAVVGGLTIGSEDVSIAAPPAILVPFMHPSIDGVYLDALIQALSTPDDNARRIARAIDWLDIAWRNTSSIDEDTRVVALRAGVEVLFGVGDKTPAIRAALSKLIDEKDSTRSSRTWHTLQGKEQSGVMTDLEWWFTNFSFLRNAIMHGDDIPGDDYLHDGKRHLWVAEETLRRALKQSVANVTTNNILLTPLERILNDALDDMKDEIDEPD